MLNGFVFLLDELNFNSRWSFGSLAHQGLLAPLIRDMCYCVAAQIRWREPEAAWENWSAPSGQKTPQQEKFVE